MRLYSLIALMLIPGVMRSCSVTTPTALEINAAHTPYDLTTKAIRTQGGYKDTLIIGDFPPAPETPDRGHGAIMLRIIARMNVPKENIIFFSDFGGGGVNAGNIGLRELLSGDYESLRQKARIVHLPVENPLRSERDIPNVAASDLVFVVAAGNVDDYYENDRDRWRMEHIYWNHPSWNNATRQRGLEAWENSQIIKESNKVIWITNAVQTTATEVRPDTGVVSCGDIKEHCFTTVIEENARGDARWHTSGASAQAAGITFYLAQFYDTPEEIVEVLKECAVDVGEPGIDREYGQGVINLACPQVLEKELSVILEHQPTVSSTTLLKTPPQARGGNLTGSWIARRMSLRAYAPPALATAIDVELTGTTNGIATFEEDGTAKVMHTVTATITGKLLIPLNVTVEETTEVSGKYVAEGSTVTVGTHTYRYTATENSLEIFRKITPEELAAAMPNYLGGVFTRPLVQGMLEEDALEIVMRFTKDVQVPSVPSNLQKAESSRTTISLGWSTPAEDGGAPISEYQVAQYSKDSDCKTGTSGILIQLSDTTAVIKNLTGNTEYYFKVRARNKAGWSPWSNCIAAKTEAVIATVPQNVRESAKTDSTITLVWEMPEDTGGAEIEKYRIGLYADQECTELIASEEAESTKIIFTGLADNTRYYFSVEAKNAAGWSPASECLMSMTEKKRVPGDFNEDGVIDFADFLLFVNVFGREEGDALYNPHMDMDKDGVIAFNDFILFTAIFGQSISG